MSKQIVTLLYLNGITDFSKVEKYLGMKDNYYEIIYDGELKKLKMPGETYEEVKEIKPKEDFSKLEKKKEIFEQKSFEEELLEAEKESKKLEELFTTTVKIETVEVKKDLKPKTTKSSVKKKEIKKLDNDIDDFIDTI